MHCVPMSNRDAEFFFHKGFAIQLLHGLNVASARDTRAHRIGISFSECYTPSGIFTILIATIRE